MKTFLRTNGRKLKDAQVGSGYIYDENQKRKIETNPMKTFLKDKQGTKRAWPILSSPSWPILSGPSHQRGGKRRFLRWICILNLILYNIQSMQTGTLEALNLDPATILSPCPLHPLQTTWLQWWGILQIHWEEKKSKKKLKYPILIDVSDSMVSLLVHKASIPFLHFFL